MGTEGKKMVLMATEDLPKNAAAFAWQNFILVERRSLFIHKLRLHVYVCFVTGRTFIPFIC